MMAYYQELNNILKSVIETNIIGNPNIRKLLYNYSPEIDFNYSPFYDENGIIRPNIDASLMYMKYVFPMPKRPDTTTEQKCYLACNLTGGDYIEGGKWQEIYLVFEIICHLDSWIIKEGYRVFSIAHEIDKTFNNKSPTLANEIQSNFLYYYQLSLPILNKPISYPFNLVDYSYKYYGLQLKYCLKINGNISCN